MDFDRAIRVLPWEEGDSDSAPLASGDCNTPLLATSPGPALAPAAPSAGAKQSNAAANHARLLWQRTEIRGHDYSVTHIKASVLVSGLATSMCHPVALPWGTLQTI